MSCKLQWGRGFRLGWDEAVSRLQTEYIELQWGRGFRLGWDAGRKCTAQGADSASMGPRLAPRMGRCPPTRAWRPRTSFNGAEARASDGTKRPNETQGVTLLQWGRGLRLGWDSSPCPHGKAYSTLQWGRGLRLGWHDYGNRDSGQTGRASMGPRLPPRMGLSLPELSPRLSMLQWGRGLRLGWDDPDTAQTPKKNWLQ